jgi:sugar/nucleoside kinase (ribokinase family)
MSRPGAYTLDVVVGGLAVVDIIGRPVERLPGRGELELIDSITLTTGGNVCNCGINLAKLGFKVGAITRTGRDGLGHFILSELKSHGVVTSGCIVDAGEQTSSTIVTVDSGGERTFLHTRGCLRNLRAKDVLRSSSLIRKAPLFAFGYYGLLPGCEGEFERLFRTLKKTTGTKILLDTGGAPRRDPAGLRAFMPYVDFFVPSLDEAIACTGRRTPEAIVDFLVRAGAPGVVGVKLGSRGCYVHWNGRGRYIRPVRVRSVVDATGAGDAFVSGLLAATLRGFDPWAAAAIGNAVAASCITAVGASTAIRDFDYYVRKTGAKSTSAG